ncbi:acyl-CoA synthetase [Afipia sp. Root123D2]|uniref:acyl-CoA synthetase n=1 Tax=Afipia sp. Root123D2 TaxID=1736436 RepID=UPI0009EBBD53|nr:acyl-CoA synthetase [Afipia sp. Root123D2]
MSNWTARPGHRVFLPKTNIAYEILDRNIEKGAGERRAIVWDSGSWTYNQLREEVDAFARGLQQLGVRKDSKILIRSRNSPGSCVAVLAAYRLGAVAVWANSLLTEDDLAYIAENSEARIAITTSDLADVVENLKARGLLDRVVTVDQGAGYDEVKALGGASKFEFEETSAEDPAFMLYSSGTTGRPKGILHAHRWIVTVGDPALIQMEYQPDDVILTPGEFSFMGTFGHAFSFPLYAGSTIVLYTERAAAETIISALDKHCVTIFVSVPTFYRMLLASPQMQKSFKATKLRFAISTGESLGAAIYEKWMAEYGTPLYDIYGVSEVEVLIGNGPANPVKPGSIGKKLVGMKIALMNDRLEEVPVGEPGVLMIHRSDPGLFLGYYRQPERWKNQHRGEWYYTGDVMRLDEDGYYWGAGREDDLFKSRGYFLSPQEIEDAILKHPAVAEAAVVGLPDEALGSKVAAFVVLRGVADEGKFEQELIEFLRSILAPFKLPKSVKIVDALPKNPVGKILRRALRG